MADILTMVEHGLPWSWAMLTMVNHGKGPLASTVA